MKKIKVWDINHAVEIIFNEDLDVHFENEFGELQDGESFGDIIKRKNITLEQMVEFLNDHKDDPNEFYFAYSDYWFEEYLNEYNITRYALEKDYGLPQSTSNNLLKNKTPFDKISLSTAYALALAANMTIDELVEKYR